MHVFRGLLGKKKQLFVPSDGLNMADALRLKHCISLIINFLDVPTTNKVFQFQLFQLF